MINLSTLLINIKFVFTEPPPPELSKRGFITRIPFYADVKIILPLTIAAVALFAAAVTLALRWKNSEFFLVAFMVKSL